MRINTKGVKQYMIDNYVNAIVTSQDSNPIEIGKFARRYYVLEIKEKKLERNEINDILKTDIQVLFNFLKKRDISKFDPKDFDETDKAREIKQFSFGSEFVFWRNTLENNYIDYYEGGISWENLKDVSFKMLKTHLLSAYGKGKYGYTQKLSDSEFFKLSKKIFPCIKLINANKSSKPKIQLYDIEEMKKDFNKFFCFEYLK